MQAIENSNFCIYLNCQKYIKYFSVYHLWVKKKKVFHVLIYYHMAKLFSFFFNITQIKNPVKKTLLDNKKPFKVKNHTNLM